MALAGTAAAGAALAGVLSLSAGPAAASRACAPTSHQKLAPSLTAPCDGAIVRSHHAVVFTANDPDPRASTNAPFLDLVGSRTLVHGHLALNTDGNGIVAQMTVVPGRAHTWTYTATRQHFASWWGNHPGTYYVQVDQVDSRSPSGVFYGPITTVRVP